MNNKIFFTVGPTEIFPQVKNYISDALKSNILSVYHRSDKFMKLFRETTKDIKILLDIPEDFHIFFLSSATECMDRIIQNLVIKDSFHFINGAFSHRFYNIARDLGKNPLSAAVDYGKSFEFENIMIPDIAELICFVQNETNTGVSINPDEIVKIKKRYPDKLIAVDIVSSVPYVKLNYKYIDCAFFSVQKGLGLPSGLAVLMVNNKCLNKTKYIKENQLSNIGSYHNFISLSQNAAINQTTETPNILGIYLLGRILEHYLDYGIEKIRNETEVKSKLLYDFFDNYEFAKPFVEKSEDRSNTTITIQSENKEAIKDLLLKNGYVVSDGYGKFKDSQFRIGNFPMHKIEDIKNIIRLLEKKSF